MIRIGSSEYQVELSSPKAILILDIGKKNQGPLDISNAESFPSLGQAQAIEDKNYKLKR